MASHVRACRETRCRRATLSRCDTTKGQGHGGGRERRGRQQRLRGEAARMKDPGLGEGGRVRRGHGPHAFARPASIVVQWLAQSPPRMWIRSFSQFVRVGVPSALRPSRRVGLSTSTHSGPVTQQGRLLSRTRHCAVWFGEDTGGSGAVMVEHRKQRVATNRAGTNGGWMRATGVTTVSKP